MSPQSTLSTADKAKVKYALSPFTDKIYYASLAQIYYAYPQSDRWLYTGLQGAISFVKNAHKSTLSFKMIDLDGVDEIIWEHELCEGFEYHPVRAFFHTFVVNGHVIGFLFSNENEAGVFLKKVAAKKNLGIRPGEEVRVKKDKGINKTLISAPVSGSFVHTAHIGYDAEKGFTSQGVDPSWAALLESLECGGVSKVIIAKEIEFIKDFVREYQGKQLESHAHAARDGKPATTVFPSLPPFHPAWVASLPPQPSTCYDTPVSMTPVVDEKGRRAYHEPERDDVAKVTATPTDEGSVASSPKFHIQPEKKASDGLSAHPQGKARTKGEPGISLPPTSIPIDIHVSCSSERGSISQGVDSSWVVFLSEMEKRGIPKDVLETKEIKDIVCNTSQGRAKKLKTSRPPAMRIHVTR